MTTWTESDLNDALERGDARVQGSRSNKDPEQTKRSASMQAVARGETERGRMNKTERRWARVLEHSEHVATWRYEEHGFRYGTEGDTHWPDFWVQREDGKVEIHEVKSYCTDAGRVRFKACAGRHPEYRWIMVVQSSKNAAWRCKYDTANLDGKPFLASCD